MATPKQCIEDYRAALERYVGGAGEDALTSAYEIGRSFMAGGFGLLELAAVHHEAVSSMLQQGAGQDAAALVRAATDFFCECLSPFEISRRGLDEATAALRRLNELLEEDIKRVAHALHDQAGTILSSAGIELDLIARDVDPALRERLASARRLLDETGEQLRHFSHELRPTLLDDLGIGPALDYLAEGVEQRTGMQIKVRTKLLERPPAAVETALYRIVQEALNNTGRHAGASAAVTITMDWNGDAIRCRIADDGVGFDAQAVLADGRRGGMGLLGMRERAQAIGGSFEIRSAPGHGTTIEIVVPAQAGMPLGYRP
jgi:signal transduction histidine kinase